MRLEPALDEYESSVGSNPIREPYQKTGLFHKLYDSKFDRAAQLRRRCKSVVEQARKQDFYAQRIIHTFLLQGQDVCLTLDVDKTIGRFYYSVDSLLLQWHEEYSQWLGKPILPKDKYSLLSQHYGGKLFTLNKKYALEILRGYEIPSWVDRYIDVLATSPDRLSEIRQRPKRVRRNHRKK